jgi:hypothetical protein
MFNDYVRALESDYCTVTAFKQHCRMMRTVNGSLDRLVRKCTFTAIDYLVISTCLLDMRACLTEKVLSVIQGHVASLAASVDACLTLCKGLHGSSGGMGEATAQEVPMPNVGHSERVQGRGGAVQASKATGVVIGEAMLMVGSARAPPK